jgi:hypothetical protein
MDEQQACLTGGDLEKSPARGALCAQNGVQ